MSARNIPRCDCDDSLPRIRAQYTEVNHICSVLTAMICCGRQLSLVTTIDFTIPERPTVLTQVITNYEATKATRRELNP